MPFQDADLTAISTPAVLVDLDIAKANIARL